jgi:hypothetical protein
MLETKQGPTENGLAKANRCVLHPEVRDLRMDTNSNFSSNVSKKDATSCSVGCRRNQRPADKLSSNGFYKKNSLLPNFRVRTACLGESGAPIWLNDIVLA